MDCVSVTLPSPINTDTLNEIRNQRMGMRMNLGLGEVERQNHTVNERKDHGGREAKRQNHKEREKELHRKRGTITCCCQLRLGHLAAVCQ